MNLRRLKLSAVATVLAFAFASQAWGKVKGDVYFGFSYVGADLYGAGTDPMKGWQAAAHFRLLRLVGVEGDVAHYSQSQMGFSEHVTTVMFGPRLTAPAGALRFFVHGLGGLARQNATFTTYPYVDYSAFSYAFGGGVDIPVFRGLKFRATGDYLGNSKAPTAADCCGPAPNHLRVGAGLAYHF
jgi:hypothetical protein